MKYIGRKHFKDNGSEITSVEANLRLYKEDQMKYSVIKINNFTYHIFKNPKRFSNYA